MPLNSSRLAMYISEFKNVYYRVLVIIILLIDCIKNPHLMSFKIIIDDFDISFNEIRRFVLLARTLSKIADVLHKA